MRAVMPVFSDRLSADKSDQRQYRLTLFDNDKERSL